MTPRGWLRQYHKCENRTVLEILAAAIIRDQQAEIERLTAKIAELKEAEELYETAETGPEYNFAYQRYQEAVKALFVELEGK